jgi:hypothetical protein
LLRERHQLRAGGQVGKPHVVEVKLANCVFGTPRGGLRTVPTRKPSPGLLGDPSLITAMGMRILLLKNVVD